MHTSTHLHSAAFHRMQGPRPAFLEAEAVSAAARCSKQPPGLKNLGLTDAYGLLVRSALKFHKSYRCERRVMPSLADWTSPPGAMQVRRARWRAIPSLRVLRQLDSTDGPRSCCACCTLDSGMPVQKKAGQAWPSHVARMAGRPRQGRLPGRQHSAPPGAPATASGPSA